MSYSCQGTACRPQRGRTMFVYYHNSSCNYAIYGSVPSVRRPIWDAPTLEGLQSLNFMNLLERLVEGHGSSPTCDCVEIIYILLHTNRTARSNEFRVNGRPASFVKEISGRRPAETEEGGLRICLGGKYRDQPPMAEPSHSSI